MAPHWVKHPEDLVTWLFLSILGESKESPIIDLETYKRLFVEIYLHEFTKGP